MAKRFLLICAVMLSCGALYAAEDYYSALDMVQNWLNYRYPKNSLALKARQKKLMEIFNSGAPNAQKLEMLKNEFPDAFKKVEMPLIFRPPLSWKIHSLSIGYDVKDEITQKTSTIDVLEAMDKEERSVEQSQKESVVSSHKVKFGIGADVQFKENVSFNPFKWLDSGASLRQKISGEYSYGREAMTQSGELWSRSKQQTYLQKRSRITELVTQQGRANLHLGFTLTLKNNSEEWIEVDRDKIEISIYIGTQSTNLTAKSTQRGVLRIPPLSYQEFDIPCRVNLNTTTARRLVEFMGEAAPTIDILKGANIPIKSVKYADVIGESLRQMQKTETQPLKLRMPGHFFIWNVRQRHTSDSREVTLREALMAANDDIHNGVNYKIFAWNNDRLESVSGIPAVGFAAEDKGERYAIFCQSGNRLFAGFDAFAFDKPIPKAGIVIWVVDFDDFDGQNLPENLKTEIFNRIKILAEQKNGSPVHKYRLALSYAGGYGVERDLKQAIEWCRKAANQGYAPAQCDLGWRHANGKGVPQSDAQAVECYRKAAEQGYAPAQYLLGKCHAEGRGVTQNDEKAAELYRKAAEQGDAKAQNAYGACHYNGKGVEQSYEQAVFWWEKAAKQGNAWAQFDLARCYENGEGVPQNYDRAAYWYHKAAEQGNAWAQFKLGWCYENDKGVPQSDVQAAYWYHKAAERKNAWAQSKLGWCYENGKGVPQSWPKAIEWYRKAATQKYIEEMSRCGKIDTPAEVAKKALEAIGNMDLVTVAALSYGEMQNFWTGWAIKLAGTGKQLSTSDFDFFVECKAMSNNGNIKIKRAYNELLGGDTDAIILSEMIDGDSAVVDAVVKSTLSYGVCTTNHKMYFKKINGLWLLEKFPWWQERYIK